MALEEINNGEEGLPVRNKINADITETNYLSSAFFPNIQLVAQSGFYANPDSSVLTPSGTLASYELVTLEEGRTYTVQNFDTGLDALSYAVYAFDSGGINGAQIPKTEYTTLSDSAFTFVVPTGKPKIGLICYIADQDNITLGLGSNIEESDTAQITKEALANSEVLQFVLDAIYAGKTIKAIEGVFRVYAQIPFSNGSQEPQIGEAIVGATSSASYSFIGYELTSGSFASGDAAGVFIVNAQSDYLSDPYTSGENLQIDAATIAIKTATPASGRWWFINDGSHDSINIDRVENTESGFRVFHNIGATKVLKVDSAIDDTYALAGWTTGTSVGLNESFARVYKLRCNGATGDVFGQIVDFSDLNNATPGSNIWIGGVLEVS